jgi:Amt family ammonium transporter
LKVARLIQWLLLGLASIACIGLVLFFSSLASGHLGDDAPAETGWSEVFSSVLQADERAEYQDELVFDGAADPTPEAAEFFSRSDRFVRSSGVLMLIGLVGFGLVIAVTARRPSGRFAPLAVLGASGVILGSYWLFGFNFSYPIDFLLGGLMPAGLGGPVLLSDPTFEDTYGYGLAFTMWTDFFYQAAFAISSGVFVTGLLAGRFRTPLVVCTAIATGSLGCPIATCWLWGAGWLFDLGAYDFAGAGPVHLLAGGVGLALVFLARIFPPLAPWRMASMTPGSSLSREFPNGRMSPARMIAFILASAIFLLLPLGMQAGSVLALDTPVVASVLHNTLMCLGGSMASAAIISIPLARRPRGIVIFVAALAGFAAVCAPSDVINGGQAAILGLVVGAVSAVVLWTLDRFGFDDPLGLVAANLVGGVIGMGVAGLVAEEASLFVQIIASIAFMGLGVTIGTLAGLIGWMTGFLWTPDSPVSPPTLPESENSPAA